MACPRRLDGFGGMKCSIACRADNQPILPATVWVVNINEMEQFHGA